MPDPRAVPPDGDQVWRKLAALARTAAAEPVPATPPEGFAERVLAGRARPASSEAEEPWAWEDWLAVRAAMAAALLAAVVVGWNVLRPGPGSAPLALEDLVELEPMP
jgi:hypothetical protein